MVLGLLAGCGPSQRDRQAAWTQAMQTELNAAHDQWTAAMASHRFSTNGQAMRDLKARYEEVYARWALRVDPLSQALLTYAVALANRVDRAAIPREDANRLYDTLKAEINGGGRVLAGETPPDQREATMLQWWEEFWSAHRQTYQATPGNPITCSVVSNSAESKSVKCD
jgi:hypothetical protein